MTDQAPSSPYVWKNPLAVWGTATGNAQAPSIRVPDPCEPWRKNAAFRVATYLVGRLKYFVIWPNHGRRTWSRTRWLPTRRNLLNIRGLYNRKTAIAEKKILDRRPIYWLFCLCLMLAGPLLFPQLQINALLTAGATFGIFAAINVCWTLIIGTASIFSWRPTRWSGLLPSSPRCSQSAPASLGMRCRRLERSSDSASAF